MKSKSVQIFVRIGALKRFHVLKQKTAELPVTVLWDRRRGERRSVSPDATAEQTPQNPTVDQRKIDRRSAPPYTWQVADFVVVEEPESKGDD